MNLEAFCYLGVLKFSEQLESSLALLPEAEKAEAAVVLSAAKKMTKPELLLKWAELRENEYAMMRRNLLKATGIQLDELAPSLQPWCIAWWADHNG